MKKLVRTSFVTSVEVADNATVAEILVATKLKLIQQVINELSENLDEIVDDTEILEPVNDEPKDIAETVCNVRVLFTDENGKHLEGIAEHNGDSDCWDCIIIDGIILIYSSLHQFTIYIYFFCIGEYDKEQFIISSL